MKLLGHLYGSKVYLSVDCGTISKKFTRKQTRKFKNHRWVKKYLKKYSYDFFTPGCTHYHDEIIMHPKVWEALQEKTDVGIQRNDGQGKYSSPTNGMGFGSIFAQPYPR